MKVYHILFCDNTDSIHSSGVNITAGSIEAAVLEFNALPQFCGKVILAVYTPELRKFMRLDSSENGETNA